MNYQNPKLQSLLAAEYALGSLRGAAGRRFERLLISEPGLRDALEYWQRRLNPLAESTRPMQPPKRVWSAIQHRIRNGAKQPLTWSLWHSLAFWRSAALASVMLAIGFALGNFQSADTSPVRGYTVAVLHDDSAKPKLVASMDQTGQDLILEMLSEPDDMGPDKVMQVWCVPKGGGKPMSLGMIDTKKKLFKLSVEQLQNLHQALEIAISVEPADSAPMDQPTGPVMYRGNMI